MIAALYARKSQDQFAVADDQKSITRQIEHASRYAATKGWTVAEAHVYADDGISGAEFSNRPGFLRLMNSLKPKPPFDVLIMSEESRLGREQLEVGYALKQIIQAGVRVWFYLEDRERTLNTPTDKIMLSLTAFADELEREKARQRTYDAMLRKARAGHVTGGKTFGYDNLEVLGPDGRRSHVERRINEAEAAIVQRIFRMCAEGHGYSRIAKTLNAEGARSPRPQQGRPAGWSPSTIHEVLKRPIYRGQIVWNTTRKRDRWGQHHQAPRPGNEWITIEAPALRIVPEDVWQTARRRLDGIKSHLVVSSQGRNGGRRRDVDSQHLLAGFARCGQCGGSFYPLSREHGKQRVYFYACSANHKRGQAVCRNALIMPKTIVEAGILTALVGDVLRPAVVTAVIEGVLAELQPDARRGTLDRLQAERAAVEREISRLVEALAMGGMDLAPVSAAVQQRQARQRELEAAITAAGQGQPRYDRRAVERQVRDRLQRWRDLLSRSVADGRQFLREALDGPIRFTPNPAAKGYRFEGDVRLGELLTGLVSLAPFMASPAGFEPAFWP
jgi:site-specific DNA recombinase